MIRSTYMNWTNHTNRLKPYTDAGKTRPSTPFQETKRETSGLGTITDWYTTIPPPKYRLRSRPLYLVEITLIVCDQQGKVWIGADSMLFACLQRKKVRSIRRIRRRNPERISFQTPPVKYAGRRLYGWSKRFTAH